MNSPSFTLSVRIFVTLALIALTVFVSLQPWILVVVGVLIGLRIAFMAENYESVDGEIRYKEKQ